MKVPLFIFAISIIFNPFSPTAFAQQLPPLKAAIHISSTVSDGKLTLEEIAGIAKNSGIDVVVFADRDIMKWEYGIPALRNLIKKSVENNSIFTYGIHHYLKDIEALQDIFPDMIFIPGTESAPFYYWRGSLFKNSLTMYNWHQHLITLGLTDPKDYQYFPVIGNWQGLKQRFSIYKIWPFFSLILGIILCQKKTCPYKDKAGKELAPICKRTRLCGVTLVILSLLFGFNNWPPYEFSFTQYQGNLGKFPYQNFIDYVNSKGGLVFWAHPEGTYHKEISKISFKTKEHIKRLFDTDKYTGFCIFPLGYKKVGRPQGIWDELLLKYCQGERTDPVWVAGSLAFDSRGSLSSALRGLQTVILAPEKSKKSVIKALANGKMYVVKGVKSLDFSLKNFFVLDGAGNKKGFIADSIRVKERPLIHIEGGFLKEEQTVEITLIKDGKVIKKTETGTPFLISYYDNTDSKKKSYYRLEIKSKNLHLVTNPVFVEVEVETDKKM